MSLGVFSDALLGNIDERKPQIGYVIGLVDEGGGKCPLAWKSKIGSGGGGSTISNRGRGNQFGGSAGDGNVYERSLEGVV